MCVGQFTALLKKSGYNAWGMDLSANAVEMAKRNHPGVEYKVLNPGMDLYQQKTLFLTLYGQPR